MLTLILASFLAAPPAGGSWSPILHPAVVVKEDREAPAVDLPDTAESQAPKAKDAPRLAPARPVPSKAKVRKARSASPQKR